MSRNSSGTATPPAGQPPAAGSVISRADHNALVNDLYAELTDSLSRSAKGGMQDVLALVDGVVGGPALTFNDEVTSGLYRAGAGDLRFAILGALIAKLTADGITLNDKKLTGLADATADTDAVSKRYALPQAKQSFSLAAGWSASGTLTPYYNKQLGRVHLGGTVAYSGASVTDSTIATLPAGYRPGGDVCFLVDQLGVAPGTVQRVTIDSSGVVRYAGPNATIHVASLDGISFLAEN